MRSCLRARAAARRADRARRRRPLRSGRRPAIRGRCPCAAASVAQALPDVPSNRWQALCALRRVAGGQTERSTSKPVIGSALQERAGVGPRDARQAASTAWRMAPTVIRRARRATRRDRRRFRCCGAGCRRRRSLRCPGSALALAQGLGGAEGVVAPVAARDLSNEGEAGAEFLCGLRAEAGKGFDLAGIERVFERLQRIDAGLPPKDAGLFRTEAVDTQKVR